MQILAVSVVYYLAQSPWLAGAAYWTIYRPLVAGFVTGMILGDPVLGLMLGAGINLIYLGFIAAGGAIPGDPAAAGYIAVAVALAHGLSRGQAFALSLVVGLAGAYLWHTRLKICNFIAERAACAAESGDMRTLALLNAGAQIPVFLLYFLSAALVLTLSEQVAGAITGLDRAVNGGISLFGSLLPYLGISSVVVSRMHYALPSALLAFLTHRYLGFPAVLALIPFLLMLQLRGVRRAR
ncbi:MAG: PTS sugar transporter subunit IIC [Bacillota bacterium]